MKAVTRPKGAIKRRALVICESRDAPKRHSLDIGEM